MIRNENEYKQAVERLAEEQKRLVEHRARLQEAGRSKEEIKRVIDPMESFHLQLQEEVESYERLEREECDHSPQPQVSGRQVYNLVTDTTTGVNVRWKDNLFQAIAILICLVLGVGVGLLVTPNRGLAYV